MFLLDKNIIDQCSVFWSYGIIYTSLELCWVKSIQESVSSPKVNTKIRCAVSYEIFRSVSALLGQDQLIPNSRVNPSSVSSSVLRRSHQQGVSSALSKVPPSCSTSVSTFYQEPSSPDSKQSHHSNHQYQHTPLHRDNYLNNCGMWSNLFDTLILF